MMDALRQYMISLVAASIICGCICAIPQKGLHKELLKQLCGIFLILTMIRPVFGWELSDFADLSVFDQTAGFQAALTGEEDAFSDYAHIIKAETEAYILDKATALHASIDAQVTLDSGEIPVPVSVDLHGEISPYAKQQLERIIKKDLNITKENQRWTG